MSEIAKVNEVRFLVEFALEQQRYADALIRIEQYRESARSVFSLGVLDGGGFLFLDYVGGSLPAAAVNGCTLTTDGMELRRWLETNDAVFDRRAQHWVMRNDKDKRSLYHFAKGVAIVPDGAYLRERRKFTKKIDDGAWRELSDVRNRSIHTPAGVSKASVTGAIRPAGASAHVSDPLNDLRKLLQGTAEALFGSFGMRVTTYPYQDLKDAIVDGLAP